MSENTQENAHFFMGTYAALWDAPPHMDIKEAISLGCLAEGLTPGTEWTPYEHHGNRNRNVKEREVYHWTPRYPNRNRFAGSSEKEEVPCD